VRPRKGALCTSAVRLPHFAISHLSYYATAKGGPVTLALLAQRQLRVNNQPL
jgi:hypothetical protein